MSVFCRVHNRHMDYSPSRHGQSCHTHCHSCTADHEHGTTAKSIDGPECNETSHGFPCKCAGGTMIQNISICIFKDGNFEIAPSSTVRLCTRRATMASLIRDSTGEFLTGSCSTLCRALGFAGKSSRRKQK